MRSSMRAFCSGFMLRYEKTPSNPVPTAWNAERLIPRGNEAKISGDVWPIMDRSLGEGMERRGLENRVREEAGREKERGWCPRIMESRVVFPEPEISAMGDMAHRWLLEGATLSRGESPKRRF